MYNRKIFIKIMTNQARVQGGGPRGLPPPHRNEKQKRKKVIRANVNLFHLYFATFLVENIIFSATPPWKKLKSKKKKKKSFHILSPPPPPYEFLNTRLQT